MLLLWVVCDTAKVRFFKQITTWCQFWSIQFWLFAILQKYDFSSKSQQKQRPQNIQQCCLRYCKSTIFQANHNRNTRSVTSWRLFAILQKYDFSSKSQRIRALRLPTICCLRYCKSTIFQANHNWIELILFSLTVVCDTAKVRFFKQITTETMEDIVNFELFAILQKYDFSSKSQRFFKSFID